MCVSVCMYVCTQQLKQTFLWSATLLRFLSNATIETDATFETDATIETDVSMERYVVTFS
jgi:hypothetical protein